MNFGEKNQNTVDSLKMKRIERMSIDCAQGNQQELANNCEELNNVNFTDYFLSNNYNAFLIDTAVSGNALYFTMVYLANKLDWIRILPKFNERSFKNLSYQLQLCYRKNPYHNQIHAADVVQNLYFMLF